MKAHYLTCREAAAAKMAAKREVERQLDDVAIRTQYICLAAMIEAGLSPRTVNRVVDLLVPLKEKYADYRTEQIADYVFYTRLKERGVKVTETKVQL